LPDYQAAQIGIIRECFDQRTIQQIDHHLRSQQEFVTVFHRRQCLFIMREAMRLSPDIPGMQPTPEVRKQLADLSLMANEHASTTAPAGLSRADSLISSMSDFIPVTEANELKFDMASISRVHKIVHDIAPARRGSTLFFDVPVLFEQASGIPLKTYETLSLAILPRILDSAKDVLTHSPHYGVRVDFFGATNLPLEQRDIFFKLLSRTPEEFRERLAGTSPPLSDFTVFKETPFLRNPDRMVPLDTTACMGKEQKQFASFWASLFEDYIDWVLTNSVDQPLNRFFPSPRYAGNHDEVCDGIIISGITAIFIECKGGFIRADAKYGGDPETLKTEVEKKYVTPQGVFQVVKSITTALNRSGRPLIEGMDLSGITTVIPLLVTRDDIGDGFFVNTYLDLRFRDAKRELGLAAEISPVYCTQLLCISVDVIEKISPYLSDTRIGAILADRLMFDPELRNPFFMIPTPTITARGTRPPQILRSLNSELSRMVAAFLNPVPAASEIQDSQPVKADDSGQSS
jgi:hypothetical protein